MRLDQGIYEVSLLRRPSDYSKELIKLLELILFTSYSWEMKTSNIMAYNLEIQSAKKRIPTRTHFSLVEGTILDIVDKFLCYKVKRY